MEKFCQTWECDGNAPEKDAMSAFAKKTQLGFLMQKGMSLSKKPLIAFRDDGDGKFTLGFKSARSGLGTISNTLGPFVLNGGEQDLVFKRPDGPKFYSVFKLSEDGNSVIQTNTHVDGKIPTTTITRTVKKGEDGAFKTLVMTQECDGAQIQQTFQAVDYNIFK